MITEEISAKIISEIGNKINGKIDENKRSQKEIEKKIDKLRKFLTDYIRTKYILPELLQKDENSKVLVKMSKINKSVLLDPVGELDFQIIIDYKILYNSSKFDYRISMIIEHKMGRTSKVLYQLFRDIIYEMHNGKNDLVMGFAINGGNRMRFVFSSYRMKNGYILSTHEINKFNMFQEYNDITLFISDEELEKLFKNFQRSKNKILLSRKILQNLLKIGLS